MERQDLSRQRLIAQIRYTRNFQDQEIIDLETEFARKLRRRVT
jgi:hypothetical protein